MTHTQRQTWVTHFSRGFCARSGDVLAGRYLDACRSESPLLAQRTREKWGTRPMEFQSARCRQ